jgi:hypothetical protein
MAEEYMVDCAAGPPTFVGELGLIDHPWRPVGKVGGQGREAQRDQGANQDEAEDGE